MPDIQVEMMSIRNLHPAKEAPEELKLAVRKAEDDPAAFARLRASIEAVGILAPLLVKTHKGKTYVAAGNRRLMALRQILTEGKDTDGLTGSIPVVEISSFGKVPPREIALMHNIALPPHPIDQFEILSALIADGMTPAEVGERYGYTQSRVAQIMAYGKLCDDVREAWRSGKLDASGAAAFTLTDEDHQAKVLKKVLKDAWNGETSAAQIKRTILGHDSDIGRMLEFIGLRNYEDAGGHVHRDLFGIDHRASDQKLVKKMVDEKVERTCDDLVAVGWKWAKATPNDSYSYKAAEPAKFVRTPEQSARLKELKKELGNDLPYDDEFKDIEAAVRLASFSDEEKAGLGCFVAIDKVGRLAVTAGWQEPAAAAPGKKKKADGDKPATTPAERKKAERERLKNAEAGRVSMKLERELGVAMRAATKSALKAWVDPHQLAGTLATIMSDLIRPDDPFGTVSDKQLEAIRADMDPATMNVACNNAFDEKSYCGSVSKLNLVAVIREAVNEDEARKAGAMSKADLEKFAIATVRDTAWLPVQLRTPHYDGPGSVKPKKRGKR